jgi:hypothetical protein
VARATTLAYSIGSHVSSNLSVVFVLYIVSPISSHLRTLGVCAWQNVWYMFL